MEKSFPRNPIIVVQARMSSVRLPGKVLRLVAGKPMLAYLLERLAHVRNQIPFVVATSREVDDNAIAALCEERCIRCVRGPLDDVAGRFLQALDETGADAFVRISGDSPFMDPALIDRALELFASFDAAIATNVQRRTFPKGMSVEVVDANAFRDAYSVMECPNDREHVTGIFYREASRWPLASFTSGRELGGINLSVDTEDDFVQFESLLRRMTRPHFSYGLDEILALSTARDGMRA